MEFLALTLMFFGIFSMVGTQIIIKWLLSEVPQKNKQRYFSEMEVNVVISVVAASFLIFWFLSPINTLWNTWTSLHPDNILFWGALLIGALVNTCIRFATTKSYSKADLSLVAPIQAMTPGLIVASAMLIGEFPSAMGYIGIFLIIVGTYVHIREGATIQEYFKPLFIWRLFTAPDNMSHVSVEAKEALLQTRSALRWAYGSAAMGTVGLLSTGIMSRHGDVAFGSAIDQIITTLIFLAAFSYLSRSDKKVEYAPLKARVGEHKWLLLSMGILYGLHMILIISAFRLAPIAYIGSLKRISIFLTVLAGIFILKESQFVWRRVGLVSIIVVGAVLLALDPTQAIVLNSLDDYLLLLRK
ncbi:MAG: hypothetical protein Q8R36_03235 [bacterium]|nr:hypothetical protein [bacterium]